MDQAAPGVLRSLRTRYPGPVGLTIGLMTFEVVTYCQRYITGSLDGVPIRFAVAMHALRALLVGWVLIRPNELPRRAALIFAFALVQVLAMSAFADNTDTTVYLVAVISGMSVLFASFSPVRQGAVVAALAGSGVAFAVYPAEVPTALAVSQSVFAGAVFAASPTAVAWFRHSLRKARSHAEVLAETDALTGLLNRRGAIARIPSLVAQAQHRKAQIIVIAMDLDHFKEVNDVHGHAVGDVVLTSTADALQGCLRRADIVSRVGGEEFIAVLNTTTGVAMSLAERVRQAVPRATVPYSVTISIGVAAAPPPAETVDPVDWVLKLLAEADQLLYQAKENGRNLVIANLDADAVSAALSSERRSELGSPAI